MPDLSPSVMLVAKLHGPSVSFLKRREVRDAVLGLSPCDMPAVSSMTHPLSLDGA